MHKILPPSYSIQTVHKNDNSRKVHIITGYILKVHVYDVKFINRIF